MTLLDWLLLLAIAVAVLFGEPLINLIAGP